MVASLIAWSTFSVVEGVVTAMVGAALVAFPEVMRCSGTTCPELYRGTIRNAATTGTVSGPKGRSLPLYLRTVSPASLILNSSDVVIRIR